MGFEKRNTVNHSRPTVPDDLSSSHNLKALREIGHETDLLRVRDST